MEKEYAKYILSFTVNCYDYQKPEDEEIVYSHKYPEVDVTDEWEKGLFVPSNGTEFTWNDITQVNEKTYCEVSVETHGDPYYYKAGAANDVFEAKITKYTALTQKDFNDNKWDTVEPVAIAYKSWSDAEWEAIKEFEMFMMERAEKEKNSTLDNSGMRPKR